MSPISNVWMFEIEERLKKKTGYLMYIYLFIKYWYIKRFKFGV